MPELSKRNRLTEVAAAKKAASQVSKATSDEESKSLISRILSAAAIGPVWLWVKIKQFFYKLWNALSYLSPRKIRRQLATLLFAIGTVVYGT